MQARGPHSADGSLWRVPVLLKLPSLQVQAEEESEHTEVFCQQRDLTEWIVLASMGQMEPVGVGLDLPIDRWGHYGVYDWPCLLLEGRRSAKAAGVHLPENGCSRRNTVTVPAAGIRVEQSPGTATHGQQVGQSRRWHI